MVSATTGGVDSTVLLTSSTLGMSAAMASRASTKSSVGITTVGCGSRDRDARNTRRIPTALAKMLTVQTSLSRYSSTATLITTLAHLPRMSTRVATTSVGTGVLLGTRSSVSLL
ncbi:unnamed protein product [Ascophyllum nodosum]